MGVVYRNLPLVPAPLVSITRNSVKGSGGLLDHFVYNITLEGWLVNVDTSKDSPGASTQPATMAGIQAAQEYIKDTFSIDGQRLEITAPGGGSAYDFDCYPTIESINFPQDKWVNLCRYTVQMNAVGDANDVLTGIESSDENWSINENENGTFNITHQINAKGFRYFTETGSSDPLTDARNWVYSRTFSTTDVGVLVPVSINTYDDVTLISGVGSMTTNYWNKSTVETYDPITYTYSLTETFIFNPTGNTNEEWSASVSFDQENTRRVQINITGVVTGFAGDSANRTQRLTNAKTQFATQIEPNLYVRLNSYVPTGYTLNPIPVTKQISYEPTLVRYTYSYSAINGVFVPGAIEDSITISDVSPSDIFASIAIPGRSGGPLIQNMGTQQSPKRTIIITARMPPPATPINISNVAASYLAKPNTDSIISALTPSVGNYYLEQNTEEFNPISRQYNRNVTWVLTSSSAAGLPSTIHLLPS